MDNFIFDKIIVFRLIKQQGSIAAAAKHLGKTPAAVSKALKQLETKVGLPLFNRTTRNIALTNAGNILYDNTGYAVNLLNTALDQACSANKQLSGNVRITLPRFAYHYFYKLLYTEFSQAYPDINIELIISDENLDAIADNFDIGMRFSDQLQEHMIARQLTPPMRLALFSSPHYLNNYGTPKNVGNLKQHKFIQYRFSTSKRIAQIKLMNKGAPYVFLPKKTTILNDTDAIIDAAQLGLGIASLPEILIPFAAQKSQFIPVLEECWQPYSALHLYFPSKSQNTKRIRVVIDYLLQKGKKWLDSAKGD